MRLVNNNHMSLKTNPQRLTRALLEEKRIGQCDYLAGFDGGARGVVGTYSNFASEGAKFFDVADGG